MNKTHFYYKLYKPYGYLSQFINNQTKRKSKKLLGELLDIDHKVMAVGRLDEKSEGLLLLSTDGKFSSYITSSKVEKEYFVMVDGIITNQAIEQLKSGVKISVNSKDYTTKPCNVFRFEDTSTIYPRFVRDIKHGPVSWITITIT